MLGCCVRLILGLLGELSSCFMNELIVMFQTSANFSQLFNYSLHTLSLAIRDYWDLGKEGQKDDKYVVLVSTQHMIEMRNPEDTSTMCLCGTVSS